MVFREVVGTWYESAVAAVMEVILEVTLLSIFGFGDELWAVVIRWIFPAGRMEVRVVHVLSPMYWCDPLGTMVEAVELSAFAQKHTDEGRRSVFCSHDGGKRWTSAAKS